MDWFSRLDKSVKIAVETGHGDTLRGQLLSKERERLAKRVRDLRATAAAGGPDSVLPRWRGEIRRRMLLLPASDRIPSMSMSELMQVQASIEAIEAAAKKYDATRMREILGA